MNLQMVVWSLMIVLTMSLLGYVVGRRMGKREGQKRAMAEAPIRLRIQAIKKGSCPVCNQPETKWYNGREEVMT